MLSDLRERIAAGLTILAQRMAGDSRYPAASRVSQNSFTFAGTVVTPDTAITVAAVWACIRYLSQTVAVLPWHVMFDGKNGAEVQQKHPIDWLVCRRPNKEWSSFQFRETLMHWALRWGNGYAEIERDQLGRPYALWPIHPDRVHVCRDTDTGELIYDVTNLVTVEDASAKVEIPASDMFHLRGFGDGPVGVNVINYAAQSIGWARAAQIFGATFFGNGMRPAGVVQNKKPLTPKGLQEQKKQFEDVFKGARNAHKTAFLDNEAEWKAIEFNARDSQLIEVHQYLVEEISRWFGVPPHKIMHLLRATFSNIEHQAIEVVVDSVSPWVKRFEDEADFKLFGQNRSGLYTKMNMRALLRGDNAGRAAFYTQMVGMGAYSPNRVLELEDENTIGTDGDIHVMQSQWVTLDAIANAPPPGAPTGPVSPLQEDAPAAAARVRAQSLLELV